MSPDVLGESRVRRRSRGGCLDSLKKRDQRGGRALFRPWVKANSLLYAQGAAAARGGGDLRELGESPHGERGGGQKPAEGAGRLPQQHAASASLDPKSASPPGSVDSVTERPATAGRPESIDAEANLPHESLSQPQ